MIKISVSYNYFKTLLYFKGWHNQATQDALKTLKNELKMYKLDKTETMEYVCA